MTGKTPSPALSVILPCEEGFTFIRRTVRALRAQTVCDRIELVLITGTADPGIESEEVAGFHSVRVVIAPGAVGNRARAAGIRQAGAPLVALAEDHCFPEPGWAAALIAAFEVGWSAVGPAMHNANPATPLSWINLLLAFGPWVVPTDSGPIATLPWHNTSYRRAPLLEYGDRLGDWMVVEGLLQQDLIKKGHRFYHEAAAETHHLNVSRLSSTIAVRLATSRLFAAYRSREWSRLSRLLYMIAAPVIPFVRLWRTRPLLRKVDRRPGLMPRVLPALLGCLFLDAIGETVGYAFGPGHTASVAEEFERLRFRYLSATDRATYDAVELGRPA